MADLPYQSLYRRFRPQRFAEVRGQDHVTTALRNAVRDDRVTHAYLFSGPRGTGKTSTARILAKAMNCDAPEDGEPCGRCDSCVAIAAGTSFDVHELDAASNNGVDAMRDLVARASLATPGRWKVYIVDEVHMLSTAASNALLKTLEEPPEHVVFVLATTDQQKVLPTIRSRTQHYEFHLLGEDVLGGLLQDVANDASLQLPDGALNAVRRRARGSARDALSALDQVAAAGVVEDDSDALSDVVRALADRDAEAALVALDGATRSGRDPQQLAVELVERLRAGFLATVAPDLSHGTSSAAEAAEASRLGTARCVRAMEVVGSAIVTMRDAPEPRITLEVALIRLAHPEADDSPAALLERLDRLERRMDAGGGSGGGPGPTGDGDSPRGIGRSAPGAAPPPPPPPPSSPRSQPARPSPAPPPPPGPTASPGGSPSPPLAEPAAASRGAAPSGAAPPSGSSAADAPTRDELVTAWGDHVLTGLRPKVRAIYQAGHFVASENGDAVLALPNGAHLVHAEPLAGDVVEALTRHFGRPVRLRLVTEDAWSGGSTGASPPAPRAPGPGTGPDDEPPPAADRADGPPPPAMDRAAGGVPARGARPPRRVAEVPPPRDLEVDEADLDEFGAAAGEDGAVLDPPGPGLSWAEDRLLRAFPGAEEVQGT